MAVLPVLRSPMTQLALAASDRRHRVDRLDAGLQWLAVTGLRFGDTRERPTSTGRRLFGCDDRSLAIERISQGINYAADHRFITNRHARATAPTLLDFVAFR